jgi:lipopolysaccharide biosynthesis protein
MFRILERGTRSQYRDFTSLFFRLKVRKQIKMYVRVCDVHTELHGEAYFYVWNDVCAVARHTYKQIHSALTGFSVVSEA